MTVKKVAEYSATLAGGDATNIAREILPMSCAMSYLEEDDEGK